MHRDEQDAQEPERKKIVNNFEKMPKNVEERVNLPVNVIANVPLNRLTE